MDTLRRLGLGAADLLFPPVCLVCDALPGPFCDACRAAIQPVEPDEDESLGMSGHRAVGHHSGPLREAVLGLKFRRQVALARPLGELLAEELDAAPAVWKPDVLVPVPLHWTRAFTRGYNQSELLAQAASRCSGIPAAPLLRRVRATPHQLGLTAAQRAANLLGAFALRSRGTLVPPRVVLVDDVRTTGSTLAECASVLRAAGAEVFGLTVTYGL